ncbi:MAG: S-layer homology domain-containing protein [Acidimicrobiales bacterium]|nr:S-layer homology domain-containing protein [Acidimicrobiales bacterium]
MRRFAPLLLSIALLAVGVGPASGVAGFGDVESGTYWARPVQWMVDNDITTGTGAGCFSPHDAVTRGQAAAFMWRMEGEPAPVGDHPFADVVAPWQQDAVAWMVEQGITTGTAPWRYSPDDGLTRGQLAALLHRLAGEPSANGHPFHDVTSGWQQAPVAWMVAEDITTGTSATTFSPDAIVTRGQLAAFFYRYKGSPAVTVDTASPACTGGPVNPPDPTPANSDPPVSGSDPADCRVKAGEQWSDVWFDIHYNPGSPSCARPEFVATGTTYIVDRDHPDASDANPGTAAAPWRTIVHAAETAATGDVVLVKAGVYDDGRIEPRTSGVVLSAYPGDEHDAIIEGWGIRAIGTSDLIVHGFLLRDIANNGLQVIGPDVDNVVFANNQTLRTEHSGISVRGVLPSADPGDFDGVRDILIIGNEIRFATLTTSEVLSVGSGVVNAHIVANELADGDPSGTGGDEGIALKEGVRDSKIYGNYVHNMADRGIHIDGGSADWDALITDIEIFGNLLASNANQGLWVTTEGQGDVDGIHIHDNIAVGNDGDGFLVYDHPHGNEAGGTVKNVVFEHNIAYANGLHSGYGGFRVNHPTATGIVFRDNIGWANEGQDLRGDPGTVFDNNLCDSSVCEYRADPMFVAAPLDFSLAPGSPAIGAATDGSDLGLN